MDPFTFIHNDTYGIKVNGADAVKGMTEEQAARSKVGGFVTQIVGDYVAAARLRYTERQWEEMCVTSLPADDAKLANMLKDFPHQWSVNFTAHNKLVNRGLGEPSEVVPRVGPMQCASSIEPSDKVEAYRTVDALAQEKRAKRYAAACNAGVKRRKVYWLASVFHDSSLPFSLGLTAADITVASQLAVAQPLKAVEFLNARCVNRGHRNVEFRVGQYAKSRKACKANVLQAADGITGITYEPIVIDGTLIVSSEETIGDKPMWTLSGSLWQAAEIDALHKLCITKGVSSVGLLFELDMVVLGIKFDIAGKDYSRGVVEHSGVGFDFLADAWGNDGKDLPVRVTEAATRVAPYKHGEVIAGTALLAKRDHVLLNWHVVESVSRIITDEVGVSVGGAVKRVELLDEAQQDVWWCLCAAAADVPEPMITRQAVVGEDVVMVYATPVGPRFSDVTSVERVEHSAVVTARLRQAQPGTSGAALVALSDGCFVGVYRGSNEEWSVYSSFKRTSRDRASIVAAVTALATTEATGTGRAVYDDMVSRGLRDRLLAVVSCIEPLYVARQQVASAFCVAGKAYTSVDPALWQFEDKTGAPLHYRTSANGGFRVRYDVQATGVKHRSALEDEPVVAMARDSNGDVVISHVGKVVKFSRGQRKFRVSGIQPEDGCNFSSSVIVAVADGSALGQVAGTVESRDGQLMDVNTWAVVTEGTFGAMEGPAAESIRDRLMEVFPYLQVVAWGAADLQAVCTPSGSYPESLRCAGERASYAAVASEAVVRAIEQDGSDEQLVRPGALREVAKNVFPRNVFDDLASTLSLESALNTLFGVVQVREGEVALKRLLHDVQLLGSDGRATKHELPPGFSGASRRASSV